MFYNQKLNIPKLLSDNHIDFKETGSVNVKVRCFSGVHIDNNPSLQINAETGEFHCFVCGIKGNILSYLISNEVIDHNEAALYVKNAVNTHNKKSEEIYKELKAYAKRRGIIKSSTREDFEIKFKEIEVPFKTKPATYNRYIKSRGFSQKDIDKWQIQVVSDAKDPFNGWVFIPIHFKGKLRTYFLRNTNGNNKIYGYKKNEETGLNEGYPRSDILYGYDKITDFSKPCYLFEGIFDKIWFDKTRNNALSLLGNSIIKQQVPYLKKFNKIVLGLDNDEGSYNLAKTASVLLVSGLEVSVWTPPSSKKDANNCTLREIIEQTYKEISLYDFYLKPEFINWRLKSATAKSSIRNS